jgi:hypothetical protein
MGTAVLSVPRPLHLAVRTTHAPHLQKSLACTITHQSVSPLPCPQLSHLASGMASTDRCMCPPLCLVREGGISLFNTVSPISLPHYLISSQARARSTLSRLQYREAVVRPLLALNSISKYFSRCARELPAFSSLNTDHARICPPTSKPRAGTGSFYTINITAPGNCLSPITGYRLCWFSRSRRPRRITYTSPNKSAQTDEIRDGSEFYWNS